MKLHALATDRDTGEELQLEGDSLADLADKLSHTGWYTGRVAVRDEPGFLRGWIDGSGWYQAS